MFAVDFRLHWLSSRENSQGFACAKNFPDWNIAIAMGVLFDVKPNFIVIIDKLYIHVHVYNN